MEINEDTCKICLMKKLLHLITMESDNTFTEILGIFHNVVQNQLLNFLMDLFKGI